MHAHSWPSAALFAAVLIIAPILLRFFADDEPRNEPPDTGDEALEPERIDVRLAA